jgi:hypothetical protein
MKKFPNPRVAGIVAGVAVMSVFAIAPMVAQADTTTATGMIGAGALSKVAPAIAPFTAGLTGPASAVNFRIPWHGSPTAGSYRLIGTIRPEGSAVIYSDQTIHFTPQGAAQLKRVTPPAAQAPTAGLPGWVGIVLALVTLLLIGLSLAVWTLLYRARPAVA